MTRLICVQLLFFVLGMLAARGAEPSAKPQAPAGSSAAARQASDTAEATIPKREIIFEISDQPFWATTEAWDGAGLVPATLAPELKEQRYVAEFVMKVPHRRVTVSVEGSSQQVNRLHDLLRGISTPGTTYRELLRLLPPDRQPPKEVVDGLVEPFVQAQGPNRLAGGGPVGDATHVAYRIFVRTPDRAKDLVRALVCFYDYGLSYPMQRECLRCKAKLLAEAAEDDKRLEALKEYDDVGKDDLAAFHTQQRLLAVDLAGVKSRIAACNKILEYEPGKTVQHARLEQVEALKTTAEIELVGLEARRSAIASIVRNAEERWALLEKKHGALAAREPNLRRVTVSGRDQTIAALADWVKTWQSCPIEQGKVTIRPIEWAFAKATPKGGGGVAK
jgi:hypothetical protein